MKTTLLGLILVVGVAGAAEPNILYIMADDHTTQAIGAYGSRLAKLNPTPTLDKLAAEGRLFTNCFVTNSICTPSRACILTGQYSHVNKVYDLGGALEPARQTLALEMKKAGYQTAMIGKWHLKNEPAAFDYYSVLPGQGKYFNPDFVLRGDKPWPKNIVTDVGKHSSTAITDRSIAWLKDEWNKNQPFFLMHHYKSPHDMFEYDTKYEGYLKDVSIPEPDSLWSQPLFGSLATQGVDGELKPYIGTSIGLRNPRRNYVMEWVKDKNLSPEEAKRVAYNEYLKRYLRCVKGVDDNLARLFAQLKSMGQFDNTIIVYTSDQGMMLGEHDYMDKRWMYDESMRMPFIIRYPKTIPAGSKSDAIIENVDFAPTLLDFAGAQAPESMQGKSFKSICETGIEPKDWKQAAYYRYWMHMAHHDNPAHFGLRTKHYKLIFYYGMPWDRDTPRTPPAWELYDLHNDPHELVNVYDNPVYADSVWELKQQLAELRHEIGDEEQNFPEIKKVVDEFWDYNKADRAKAMRMSHDYAAMKKAEQNKK